ncbi:MAG: PepSY domain-containing protein [Alcanivoracaceae bacterium]|nr:PepSY domain-containing protein [Alcanivoracaceae bacterium]
MRVLLVSGLLAFSTVALAGPECEEKDRSKWMDKDAFEQQLKDDGYRVKVFKITDGDCYELYGWNPEGQKVEIYYDPVTAKVLKTEIEE